MPIDPRRASALLSGLLFLPLLGISGPSEAGGQLAGAASTVVPSGTTVGDALRGQVLIGELGCTACHAAGELVEARVHHRRAPDLTNVGARVRPDYLLRYLLDPQAEQPGTAMPHALAGIREDLRVGTAEALVHYLVDQGGPMVGEAQSIGPELVEAGRQIFHRVGCAGCHEPIEFAWALEETLWELEPVESVEGESAGSATDPEAAARDRRHLPLAHLHRKTTQAALEKFLRNPGEARPSGRMPDCGLGDFEARAIASYLTLDPDLLDTGLAAGLEAMPGLEVTVFEGRFGNSVPDFDELEPDHRGVVDRIGVEPMTQDDDVLLRFRGFVNVPADGRYDFHLTSDDGSMLWIDGEVCVDNDGVHSPRLVSGFRTLGEGLHTIEVAFFEHGGGAELELEWEGPGLERSAIPPEAFSHTSLRFEAGPEEEFIVDPQRVRSGEILYGEMGCLECHGRPGGAGPERSRRAPVLESIAASEPTTGGGIGCIGDTGRPGLPLYDLSPNELGDLSAAFELIAAGAGAPEAGEAIDLRLEALRCTACHARNDLGGPDPERRAYFRIEGGAELGDEGRIPPHLDATGRKLTDEWMRGVLLEGKRWRPYMATRMPEFEAHLVENLSDLFRAADLREGDETEPEFSVEAVEAGRKLVGTQGLGCIQCHTFAEHGSLGVPAVDLTQMSRNLQPAWFRELLRDPSALNMNTRMPLFWEDGKSPLPELLDGDPDRQADAIRTYLSLGAAAPLPHGLVVPEGTYEVTPIDAPEMVGVFMEGVSPRTLLIGYPERLHVAFDMQGSRLAKAWRGRFFNAHGTWHARAGALERPPGNDVCDLPSGPAFARMAEPEGPWPLEFGTEGGFRALGRRIDPDGYPILRYSLGNIVIEERPYAQLAEGGTTLVRSFKLQAPTPIVDLWFRLGPEDGEGGEGRVKVPDRPWLLTGSEGDLRMHVPFDDIDSEGRSQAEFEVVWTW